MIAMEIDETPIDGTPAADGDCAEPSAGDCARARGRPRGFCREQALRKAMTLFWRHGYEGVSVSDLTRELCIAPPSLYAAFGSKDELYRLAVQQYLEDHGRKMMGALDGGPTVRAGIARMLREAAVDFTAPGRPSGCMVSAGALAAGEAQRTAAAYMTAQRDSFIGVLEDRVSRARAAGELAPGADPRALARLVMATLQGMSIQARDGAPAAELEALADAAMAAWPEGPRA
ncbi:MAG TPA: TetR/AcrR family transcriptional regulator [Azospirillaceae bacterium]|nr:TetR/AcrR family transcriptional regulator [Azospirillaceae bacterium]